MFFKRYTNGMLSSNCYIAGQNGECVVIDPGIPAQTIADEVLRNSLKVKYIFLTHAHIDHIVSMEELKKKTGALTVIHSKDAPSLGNQYLNGALLFGKNTVFSEADIMTEDGDRFNAGGLDFKIIHTPGHTPGSMCILVENILFTGDTLFYMSVGNTELGNGDAGMLETSLRKLALLDDNVTVYPGHGTKTSIGFEKANNPFILC